ncbi:hypothetical protein [Corynebacterium phocae]|nr:hypothetical protein [Corynebacterium phocae]KAA8727956.1 hypothetical protein F4V58_01105 [Corynebacterium phocae]
MQHPQTPDNLLGALVELLKDPVGVDARRTKDGGIRVELGTGHAEFKTNKWWLDMRGVWAGGPFESNPMLERKLHKFNLEQERCYAHLRPDGYLELASTEVWVKDAEDWQMVIFAVTHLSEMLRGFAALEKDFGATGRTPADIPELTEVEGPDWLNINDVAEILRTAGVDITTDNDYWDEDEIDEDPWIDSIEFYENGTWIEVREDHGGLLFEMDCKAPVSGGNQRELLDWLRDANRKFGVPLLFPQTSSGVFNDRVGARAFLPGIYRYNPEQAEFTVRAAFDLLRNVGDFCQEEAVATA